MELGPELFAFVTALLVAISFMLEFGSVAMKHTGFAVAWSRIHEETLALWNESERSALSHDELRAALRDIHRRIEPIDQQSIPHRVDMKVTDAVLRTGRSVRVRRLSHSHTAVGPDS